MSYITLAGFILLLWLICLSVCDARECDCSDYKGEWIITRQHFEFNDNTKNIEPTNKLQEFATFIVNGCSVDGIFGNGGNIKGTISSGGGQLVGEWSQGEETGDIPESFILGFDPDNNGERNCDRFSGRQTVKYGRESWKWTGYKEGTSPTNTDEPTTAEGWLTRGQDLYKQSKYDEAISAYNKAIGLNPQDANSWYNLGLVYHMKGDTVKARLCQYKALDFGYPDNGLRDALDGKSRGSSEPIPVTGPEDQAPDPREG